MRLLLPALLALVALGCGSAGAENGHLRVLFVGNSLTAVNDLPGIVSAIGRADGRPIDVETFAPGGYALEDHWANGRALKELDRGGWDFVVLQQGPSSLPESRANLIEWATRWADEARLHGVQPALYQVWPERERFAVFPAVVDNYAAAAHAAGADLCAAGAAWQSAFRRSPKIPLYGPDGFHPSKLGTYVAALVIYAGLTGRLPRDLRPPGRRLPLWEAEVVRLAASDGVRAGGPRR